MRRVTGPAVSSRKRIRVRGLKGLGAAGSSTGPPRTTCGRSSTADRPARISARNQALFWAVRAMCSWLAAGQWTWSKAVRLIRSGSPAMSQNGPTPSRARALTVGMNPWLSCRATMSP